MSASSVAVMRPPAGDPVLEEASVRIRAELDATGTSNRLIDCPGPGTPERPDCADSSSAARISLFREDGIATIQVMASLPDGLELRRHVRVPPETGGDDPSVLAVRAVELLRDMYLDIPRVASRQQPAPPSGSSGPAKAAGTAPPAGAVSGRAFVGAGVLQGRWGLGAAPAPAFGFGVSFLSRLVLMATVAGPFHTSVGFDPTGRAETWQTLAALQLRYEIGWARLRPFATAGVGIYSMRVQPEPQPNPGTPIGLTPSALAPLVIVGVGIMVRILPWLAVTADVQEMVTLPTQDVTAGARVIGRAGGPSESGPGGAGPLAALSGCASRRAPRKTRYHGSGWPGCKRKVACSVTILC